VQPADAILRRSSVDFAITESMVRRFVALTGDRSHLHVSDQFARRSAFRRPVAHGMLQVAHLALTHPFRVEGFQGVPVKVTGRFLAPSFPGESFRLTVVPTADGGGGATPVPFDYEIANTTSDVIVTRGSVLISYIPRSTAVSTFADDGSMVREALAVNDVPLEDIQVGQTDQLAFSMSATTMRDFGVMLTLGASAHALPEPIAAGCHLPNLLALLLLSTSIGVCLPGAGATFLEFSAEFIQAAQLGIGYHLAATVTHRSTATRIVKKSVTITENESASVVARGRVAALVAQPLERMPSFKTLRESTMDFGLGQKVALVTGASRGMGETIAKALAVHGAKVVVNYHRGADDAKRVVEEIVGNGGQAVDVQADVSRPGDVEALVKRALEQFGGIHVLVNNAARDARPIPFGRTTWDDMQGDLDVIVKGAFCCCKEVVPVMMRQGGGKIVNVGTVFTDNPPPDQLKYVVAKSALVGLTRSLAIELAAHNIQVNLVVPSFVETDFVAHVPEGFRKKYAESTPMGRNASPIDVARAVLFLASSHSSFTTGQKVMVTGGGAPYV
jgi:3-oxoacyl-[acyl-carrier protein] reductase